MHVSKKNNSGYKVINTTVSGNKEIVTIPLLRFCRHTYTGDKKMNQMIEEIRKYAPLENYIA